MTAVSELHAIERESPAERRDISVIVPVHEGAYDLPALYEAYAGPLRAGGRACEFLFVAVPGARRQVEELATLIAQGHPIRIIESARLVNETALLRRGFAEAEGEIIVTLPAQRQIDPDGIDPLIETVELGADVAVACRWPRGDARLNRMQSWLLYRFVRVLGGGRFHDLGCGVRAMRKRVTAELPLYGELARFFPLIAQHHGFAVEEVKVAQHPNDLALRIHRPGTYFSRLLDLFGLFFVLRFTDRPLRFFGLFGALLTLVGLVIMGVLLVDRMGGQAMGTRPLLLVAVFCLALGGQAVAFGLIGEMIVHFNASRARAYRVKEIREQSRT